MRRAKSINFFATRSDLNGIFIAVEAQQALKYVQAGMFDSPELNEFSSGLKIPNLGLAPSGTSNLEPFWLVTDAHSEIIVKSVPQRRGGVRYGIDPGLNPESVIVWPGGNFDRSTLIAGQIGTGVINPESTKLFNLFIQVFRKRFNRIRSYFVGPEAEQLLDQGGRLTWNSRSPQTRDLRRN
jgi:hypothetical protein